MRTGPRNSPLGLSVCLSLQHYWFACFLVVVGVCICVARRDGAAEIICIGMHGDAELLQICLPRIPYFFIF